MNIYNFYFLFNIASLNLIFSHDLSLMMQAAECFMLRRRIRVDSLSGTLSTSYASLSKIVKFEIVYTKLSGTLPMTFGGSGIFSVSASLVSGSLPDMSFWRNVTVLSLAGNKLSGTFSAERLPPKTSYFNASSNRLSADTLQLSALPATTTLVDLSRNLYQGLSLKASDLTVQVSLSTSLVVNLEGNHIFCPLPGKSELPSNLDLLTDRCEIDYHRLIPYGTSLACVLVVALATFLLGKCHFKQIYTRVLTWILQPRLLFAKYCVIYLIKVLSLVSMVWSFCNMFSALEVESPDSCSLVNLKQLWINNIPAVFANFDGTSFPSPDLYTNFSQYASLLLSGFPGQQFPEIVQENIVFFRSMCLDFASGECAYQNYSYRCYRVVDFAQNDRDFFSKFLWASAALVVVKEFIKLLAVLYTSCAPARVPSVIEVNSLWAPLLALSLRRRCCRLEVLVSPPFFENLHDFLFEGYLSIYIYTSYACHRDLYVYFGLADLAWVHA